MRRFLVVSEAIITPLLLARLEQEREKLRAKLKREAEEHKAKARQDGDDGGKP